MRLIEAEARVYDEAPRFLAGVKQALEVQKREQRLRNRLGATTRTRNSEVD